MSSISLNRKWVYFLLQSRFKVGMLRYINLQYIIILSRQVCDTSMVKWSSRLLSMLKALVEGPDYAFPCIPLRASGAGSIPVRRILFLQYPQWFFFESSIYYTVLVRSPWYRLSGSCPISNPGYNKNYNIIKISLYDEVSVHVTQSVASTSC